MQTVAQNAYAKGSPECVGIPELRGCMQTVARSAYANRYHWAQN